MDNTIKGLTADHLGQPIKATIHGDDGKVIGWALGTLAAFGQGVADDGSTFERVDLKDGGSFVASAIHGESLTVEVLA